MSLNLEKYQSLVTLLLEFRQGINTSELDVLSVRQRLAELKQLFGEEIAPSAEEDTRIQPYKTEISKQLRLLEVDVMFLQGARQPSTAKTRLNIIGDRLNTLIQYCHAILQQKSPDTNED
ncbi:heterocyst frequency control protein PatD [Nostoc parmelioides]|uniref:Heterocyst frequency control protein PatD n=1 Tax=Nostoc parmelioides FACHB-3921 TaxID=2692909 RepID=A0ABR8B9B9_9NOSO|nr:heterocyst frequency control protein PatD [Nostoc parmelioides]MBD2250550.1 heterocyst frequency control protein PatD [Nostoc parmelioides FACHB-3921]